MYEILAIAAGGAAGVLTAIPTTIATARAERKRDDRAHNRALIADARRGLGEWEESMRGRPTVRGEHPSFLSTGWYLAIASHLEPEDRKRLEGSAVILSGGKRDPYARIVATNLDRVEAKWGLRPTK
jgi:hypothetical protein